MNSYEDYAKVRDSKGFTNYQVAKEADISQSILSAWKAGNTTPTLNTLVKIADAMDVLLPELMGYKVRKEK